jgi:hypothetical protein
MPDVTGILSALDAAESEAYGRAVDLMQGAEATAAAISLGERYYSWMAGFAFRAGRLQDSERFRRLAVEKALEAGDRHQVDRLHDFGKRIEWAAASSPKG